MQATPPWLASIEALLNRGIDASAEGSALARRLTGTTLRVQVEGLPTVRAAMSAGRLGLVAVPRAGAAQTGDHGDSAVISGTPWALLRLARGAAAPGGSHTVARISGDAEVANSYRRLFALARPDLEEELSRLVGDLPARRLAQLARRTVGWARGARRAAGENVAEFLQEESRDVVGKPEIDEFLNGVDALRDIAERIEARLARLEQRRQGPA